MISRSKDILSYIEASSRWGAGMPTSGDIAKGLGIRAKNVDSALETLAINGRLVRSTPTDGRRIAYALAPQRRFI